MCDDGSVCVEKKLKVKKVTNFHAGGGLLRGLVYAALLSLVFWAILIWLLAK